MVEALGKKVRLRESIAEMRTQSHSLAGHIYDESARSGDASVQCFSS